MAGPLATAEAAPTVTLTVDLDGDGKSDEVGAGADGVLKVALGSGGSATLALTPAEAVRTLEAGKVGAVTMVLARGVRGRALAVVLRGGQLVKVVDEPAHQDGATPGLAVEAGKLHLWWETPAIWRCGGGAVRLLEQVVDPGKGARKRLVRAVKRPAGTVVLAAQAAAPAGLLPSGPSGGYRFVAATSPTPEPAELDAPPAPVALNDGKLESVWREDGPGDGRGELLTAQAPSPAFKVLALRLTRAAGVPAANQPRELTLWFDSGARVDFDVPRGDGEVWLALAQPVASRCVTVELGAVWPGKGAPAGGGELAVAGLEVWSELDLAAGGGLEQLVAKVRAGGLEGHDAVVRLRAVGAAGAQRLSAVFDGASAPERLRLGLALAELGAADAGERLMTVLAAGVGEDEQARVRAALVGLREAAVPALAARLGAAQAPLGVRVLAAQLLGGLASDAALAALLAVDSPDVVLRGAVGEALIKSRAPGAAAAIEAAWVAASAAGAGAGAGAAGAGAGELREADLARAARGHVGTREAGAEALLARVRTRAAEVRAARKADAQAAGAATAAAPAPHYELAVRLTRALGTAWQRAGDEAARAELLATVAEDPEAVLRQSALEEAARRPDNAVAAAALAARGDADPRVRALAATVLAGVREAAVRDALRALLARDPWPFVRESAAGALATGCVLDGRDLGALLAAGARDEGDQVRVTALRALVGCLVRAKSRRPEVGQLLVRIAGDADDEIGVRVEAAGLLGQLGDPGLVPAMLELLDSAVAAAPYSEGATLQAAAMVGALGRMCPVKARKDIQALAADPDPQLAAAAQRAQSRCKW